MRKWIAILLAVCVMCIAPTSSFATENNEPDSADQTQEITARAVYDFLVEQATQSNGIETDAIFDVNANLDSFQMLNLQYEILQISLSDKGFGKNGTLEIPEFQMGYASNVQEIFQQNFGDLRSQLSLEPIDLPDSFSVSGMLADTQDARDSFSAGFKSSEIYQVVNDQLSIGRVFEQAQNGASMPSLSTDFENMLEALTGNIETQLDVENAIGIFNAAKQSNENAFNLGAGLFDQAAAERWSQSILTNSANLKSGSSFMEATAKYMNKTLTEQNLKNLSSLMSIPLVGMFYGGAVIEEAAKLEEMKDVPTFEDLLTGNY